MAVTWWNGGDLPVGLRPLGVSIDGGVCPLCMYYMSHERWIVWWDARWNAPTSPDGGMSATSIANARAVVVVASTVSSSRRRCRRSSVSTRARRGFLAEKLLREGEGEGEGEGENDARALERRRVRVWIR